MELSDMLESAAPKINKPDMARNYVSLLQKISIDLPESHHIKKKIEKFLKVYVPYVEHAESMCRVYGFVPFYVNTEIFEKKD